MGPALIPLAVTVGGALISKMMAPSPPKPPQIARQAQSSKPPTAPSLASSASNKASTTVTGPQGLLSDDPANTTSLLS